jgi:Dolichyl-phosphate-mannose-protein mannosyltransferase
MAVCVAALAAGAAAFLPQQSIWVDEAAQITGLRLGPVQVAGWLAGADRRDFGQFRDRMPPLSYWVGWCWVQAFGRDEAALRWLSVLEMAGATALIYVAARRAFGPAAAWVAGLSFALSPAVVVLAVEIRAYALFVLCSAGAFYFLVGALADGAQRRRDVVGLMVALAAAILTHFFGLVLSGGVLIALATFAATGKGRWATVLAVASVVAIAAVSISPFVLESFRTTRFVPARSRVLDELLTTCRLLPGLTSHPALALFPPAEVSSVAAVIVLAILATLPLGPRRRAQIAVVLVLMSGLAAVAVVKVTKGSFDAARPTYNAWTWPGISLLLGSGLGCSHPVARRAAGLAAGLLIAALGIGVIELAHNGTSFAHTPHRRIARMIRELGERDVAVIHDDPSYHLVHISGPLRCEFGEGLKQYRLEDAAPDRRPSRLRTCEGVRSDGPEAGPAVELPQPVLVVIHSQNTPPRALLGRIREGTRFEGDGPISRDLRASPSWRLVDRRAVVAEHSADILVFRRVGRAGIPEARASDVARRPSSDGPRLNESAIWR